VIYIYLCYTVTHDAPLDSTYIYTLPRIVLPHTHIFTVIPHILLPTFTGCSQVPTLVHTPPVCIHIYTFVVFTTTTWTQFLHYPHCLHTVPITTFGLYYVWIYLFMDLLFICSSDSLHRLPLLRILLIIYTLYIWLQFTLLQNTPLRTTTLPLPVDYHTRFVLPTDGWFLTGLRLLRVCCYLDTVPCRTYVTHILHSCAVYCGLLRYGFMMFALHTPIPYIWTLDCPHSFTVPVIRLDCPHWYHDTYVTLVPCALPCWFGCYLPFYTPYAFTFVHLPRYLPLICGFTTLRVPHTHTHVLPVYCALPATFPLPFLPVVPIVAVSVIPVLVITLHLDLVAVHCTTRFLRLPLRCWYTVTHTTFPRCRLFDCWFLPVLLRSSHVTTYPVYPYLVWVYSTRLHCCVVGHCSFLHGFCLTTLWLLFWIHDSTHSAFVACCHCIPLLPPLQFIPHLVVHTCAQFTGCIRWYRYTHIPHYLTCCYSWLLHHISLVRSSPPGSHCPLFCLFTVPVLDTLLSRSVALPAIYSPVTQWRYLVRYYLPYVLFPDYRTVVALLPLRLRSTFVLEFLFTFITYVTLLYTYSVVLPRCRYAVLTVPPTLPRLHCWLPTF